MQTQKPHNVADFWFVTSSETQKIEELTADPHVNLAYYRSSTREWVSVSGLASLTANRDLIRSVYNPEWKTWLGDAASGRDGSPDDPRIVLVLVEVLSATFLKVNESKPRVLFEVAKAKLTGKAPAFGEIETVRGEELR
jgi:general stress protein 26